jgi:hypothetical protein
MGAGFELDVLLSGDVPCLFGVVAATCDESIVASSCVPLLAAARLSVRPATTAVDSDCELSSRGGRATSDGRALFELGRFAWLLPGAVLLATELGPELLGLHGDVGELPGVVWLATDPGEPLGFVGDVRELPGFVLLATEPAVLAAGPAGLAAGGVLTPGLAGLLEPGAAGAFGVCPATASSGNVLGFEGGAWPSFGGPPGI